MLSAFANAFRTPDLRRKILFTLFILAVFRLGSVIPVPNVNVTNINTCVTQASSGSSAGLYSMIRPSMHLQLARRLLHLGLRSRRHDPDYDGRYDHRHVDG